MSACCSDSDPVNVALVLLSEAISGSIEGPASPAEPPPLRLDVRGLQAAYAKGERDLAAVWRRSCSSTCQTTQLRDRS